jgi:hypothetical protein
MTWTSWPAPEVDTRILLEFFAEPDFVFRTPHPDLLSEQEIQTISADAWVLYADDRPVGLYALEQVRGEGSPHCHYILHLRLVDDTTDAQWTDAFRETVRALRWRAEVIRLTTFVGDFDKRWEATVRDVGLVDEGMFDQLIVRWGERRGLRQFALLWEEAA